MGTSASRHVWRCRPGRVLVAVVSLALALAAALACFGLALSGGSVWWLIGGLPATMWIGLQAAPLLLHLLGRLGIFGTVRRRGDRLLLGRGSRAVDLSEPLTLEARLQQSTIRREYDMRFVLVNSWLRPAHKRIRRWELRVLALTLVVRQAGHTYCLAADETGRRPGPAFDADAHMIRRVALGPTPTRPVRLWPAHLAEVLRLLQEAPEHEAVTTPIPDEALEDPRRAVWPWRRYAVWSGVLLILAVIAGFWIFQRAQEAHRKPGAGKRQATLLEDAARGTRAEARIVRRGDVVEISLEDVESVGG